MDEQSIFNDKDGFQPLVKKAKKKSLKKTIIVSTVVTASILLLLGIIIISLYFIMERSMGIYQEIKYEQNLVYGANIHHDKTSVSYGVESIFTQDQYKKEIAGIPYTWYNEQTWFKLYDKPTTIYDNSISSSDHHQFYRNGQRVVNFYIPGDEKFEDDSEFLQSLSPTNVVEIALSFDDKMTPDDMQKQFPTAQWAWIQHPEEAKGTGRVIGDYAYGFAITNPEKGAASLTRNVENFKKVLEKLSVSDEKDTRVSPLLASIRESGDVEVSGVILTGTVEELVPLIKQDVVNYVSVGVIVPY